MTDEFFSTVPGRIPFGGLDSTDPLAFKVYEPDRVVLGKRMEDHLRIGVCLWHSFAWDGRDMFGIGTLDRPWLDPAAEPMPAARRKMAVAFEFIEKLGMPWYCFHDRDVAPEGTSFAEFRDNLDALTDDALGYQERTGATLLWGTANLFTHPRYQGGAATNPDPEVFAYAAAQVKHMLEVTQRLGGANYVLWGGREGYDTLLNTDLKREGDQLARFLHLVAEHKHRIGFEGTLLIEPKPMEPTKHQYDYDSATIHGFLVRNGLEDEYRLNIEANHATLAGHSLPPRGRLRGRERDPRLDRREPRRSAERLGHGSVPELGRGPRPADLRDPQGRRPQDRRLQLRREAAPPEQRPRTTCSTPTSAGSTRSRGPCWSPPSCSSARRSRSRATSATPAGTGALGAGDPRGAGDARPRSRHGSRPARSTRSRSPAARSSSRAPSTR